MQLVGSEPRFECGMRIAMVRGGCGGVGRWWREPAKEVSGEGGWWWWRLVAEEADGGGGRQWWALKKVRIPMQSEGGLTIL